MFNFLAKQKFPAILLFFGVMLILAGFVEIKDITKLNFTTNSKANYIIAGFGGLLTILSIFIYLFDELSFGWLGRSKIKKNDLGFGTNISKAKINILFGRLETLSSNSKESMVVLPANEFFDDECIRDKKSALGAYVNYKFENQEKQIENLLITHLDCYQYIEVEKEVGVKRKSYGVGEGVFLKEPLGSRQPILFLAVTTKRAKEGLRTEMSYIFQAVRKIQHVAAE